MTIAQLYKFLEKYAPSDLSAEWDNDGLPCLTLLGVKDTQRGRGIGQMLLKFYIEVMTQLGFKECALVVNDWNPRARKLYDSLGFKLRRSYEDQIFGGWMNHILVKKL